MNNKHTSDNVPIIKVPENNDRINNLYKRFEDEFKCKPNFFVRVPGRVNIIGEHIDYCGYPVLPMALEQDILVAVGVISNKELQLRNVGNKYCNYNTPLKKFEEVAIESDSNGKPFWYNYVLCGIKGGLEFLNNKILNGVQLYIDGNIPPASGLSSSSALVSAACLAFLHAQNVVVNKTEIADLCAKSERYIGTQGGGMDQAIAFLAEKYCAQYITWNPLKATPVSLPEDVSFVVAHSLAEVNKAAGNDYNRRVIECRLAAKLLTVKSGLQSDEKIILLSDVQKNLGKSLNDMVALVHEHLSQDLYTKSEVCNVLDVTESELDDLYLTPNTRHLKEFKLRQRALHVYEEALRVENFRNTCTQSIFKSNGTNGSAVLENGDSNKTIINKLGSLISGSHDSMRNLYECSHKNLDILVDISSEFGVYARLTGAGWGGCIISICPQNKTDKYIETLVNEFYVKHCNINTVEASKYVFATTPNYGAAIYKC